MHHLIRLKVNLVTFLMSYDLCAETLRSCADMLMNTIDRTKCGADLNLMDDVNCLSSNVLISRTFLIG